MSAGFSTINGRRLAGNAGWNFAGLALPLGVALATIPALISGLGAERFGVLALAWTLIGYCGLFDLGIGRALTRLVAESSADDATLAPATWTAMVLLAGGGLAGGLLLAIVAGRGAMALLRIPEALQGETLGACYWISATLPVVTVTAGLRGILEAQQRFRALSVARAWMGAFTFLGPLAAVQISPSLPAVMASLAATRLVYLAALAGMCARGAAPLFSNRRFSRASAAALFRFGGWLTVSNILSPLMVSLDRFLVAALLSVSMVAYYATPWEIVTKLQVIPAAIAGVLFPALSQAWSADPWRARRLFVRSTAAIAAVLAPVALGVAALAGPGLEMWLGGEFAARGTRVMQLLATGVFVNATAYVPSAFLQASGRPDWNAKLHLAELPLYLAAAVWLIRTRGIEGAALAWLLRVSIDAALLFWLARKLFRSRGVVPSPLARRLVDGQRRLSAWFDRRFLDAEYRVDGNRAFVDAVVNPRLGAGQVVYDVGGGKNPLIDIETKRRLKLKVAGLDIDAAQLAAAPAGAYDRRVEADITGYRGSGDADLVICQALLEHVRDTGAAMASLASVLRPGGRGLIFVPSRNALFARLNLLLPEALKRKILYAVFPSSRRTQGFPAFYDRCTPRDFRRLAEAHGLEVEECRTYFESNYFSCCFPLHVAWRLWLVAFRRVAGEQAAETFTLIVRKPGSAIPKEPEERAEPALAAHR